MLVKSRSNNNHILLLWCDNSVLPSQICHQYLSTVSDVKDLYGAVGGTGGEARSVIIHLSVVLKQREHHRFLIWFLIHPQNIMSVRSQFSTQTFNSFRTFRKPS